MYRQVFLPLHDCKDYIENNKENGIFYTRFSNDFQSNCFLYHKAKSNSITRERAAELNKSIDLCYVYDMFHFENIEFTVEGFKEINNDIQEIIKCGFKYIMVSNPFIIEILGNEYSRDINVVVSSQLEINSSQSKIFFDVLNNTDNISHIIISQNYMCKEEFNSIIKAFNNKKIVVEIDRVASRNQIIYECYYNMLYGYYNESVEENIIEFLQESKKYISSPDESILKNKNIAYKVGEITLDRYIVEENLNNLVKGDYNSIKICDYSMWNQLV